MSTWKGTWSALVHQAFEVEADHIENAEEQVDLLMRVASKRVDGMHAFEIDEIEEVVDE